MTRSVERRIAAMKGEPAPQFDGGKMKRTMLKEEKELRRLVIGERDSVSGIFYVTVSTKTAISKALVSLINAAREQERERCAKLIASECKKKTLDSELCKICAEMIAAIRKG